MSMLECTAVDIRLKVYAHYAPTRRGSQLDHNAQDRMIMRKPTARTNERRMTAEANQMSYILGDDRAQNTHS